MRKPQIPFARRGGEADDIGSAPCGELVALEPPPPTFRISRSSCSLVSARLASRRDDLERSSASRRRASASASAAPRGGLGAEDSSARLASSASAARGVPARGVPARGDGAPDGLEPRLASVSAAETHSLRFTGLSILVLVIGRRPAAGHTRARSIQCATNGHDRRTRRCVCAFVPAHAVLPGGRAHQIGAHASGVSRALHRDVARGDARHDRDDEVAAYHHALVIRLVLVGLGQRGGLDHGIVSIGRVHGWRAETDGTRMRSSRIKALRS